MQKISQQPGRELLGGRYRLGTLIASGGMSVVHRGWDVAMQRAVAVKLYMPNQDSASQRRFDEEARTLAALTHPGLVAVYDTGTDDEQPYLVLQLVDGPTLRDHLGAGPLTPPEVRALGVRQTLAYVHCEGVIHRDVKPSNILLDEHRTPYLADFGISRTIDGSRLTATGQFVGTAGYLAPEQVRGQGCGPAVDVYALGLVLLECLTGQAEYTGSDVEMAVARLSRPPRIPDDAPDDLGGVIAAMTADDPALRPSAAECADLLDGRTRVPSRGAPARTTMLAHPRRRRRLAVGAAAGITVAAASVGFALLGGTDPLRPAHLDSAPPASLVAPAPQRPAATPAPAVAPAAAVGAPGSSERGGPGFAACSPSPALVWLSR